MQVQVPRLGLRLHGVITGIVVAAAQGWQQRNISPAQQLPCSGTLLHVVCQGQQLTPPAAPAAPATQVACLSESQEAYSRMRDRLTQLQGRGLGEEASTPM